MKNTLFFTTSLLLLTLASCKDKNKSVYENCCGTEATVDSFRIAVPTLDQNGNIIDSTSAAQVYIPNIFINDNSGDNNLLMVFGGPSIERVTEFKITNEDGDLLFQQFDFLPNDPGFAWEGLKPNGTPYQGLCTYLAIVKFIDGQTRFYQGKACVYNCTDQGFPNENLPGCFFPSQHDGNGGRDPSLPYNACF